MDYIKIGKFIAEERKDKGLTQAKLAEQLFVSEKTVSKWENGKGVPETDLLPKICEIFEIEINELLSGEKIQKEDARQKETLILDMAKEIEQKNKVIWSSMWVIISVSLVVLLSGLLITAFFIPKGVWQIVAIVLLCVVFLLPCFYALKLEVSVGKYKCKKCGSEIVPSYSQALCAMHYGTTRYLKCPKCNKHSWCKKELDK
ncbi:MAG: helix-turn-helix transcriptional regulator [Clostridia bacterium]|nr:helix-turn-helix transcriptional regulator [Clostridia bacterium]